jgi:hypothetical protein
MTHGETLPELSDEGVDSGWRRDPRADQYQLAEIEKQRTGCVSKSIGEERLPGELSVALWLAFLGEPV